MRLSLAGLRRHPVLLAGGADRSVLARLEPFFEVELASALDGFDREALCRMDGRTPLDALAGELTALVERGIVPRAELGPDGSDLRAVARKRLEGTLGEAARLALLVPSG